MGHLIVRFIARLFLQRHVVILLLLHVAIITDRSSLYVGVCMPELMYKISVCEHMRQPGKHIDKSSDMRMQGRVGWRKGCESKNLLLL